jgi:Transposase DDE domain group 1
MDQCATPGIRFAPPVDRPVVASFDAGRLTSDGGLAWLREAEDDLAVCASLAAEVPEWRRGKPRHTLRALVTQRVFQIACGYEDQNDATALRRDPLLKLVCGRLPSSDPDLASQPTLSRLENAVTARACYRLAWALGQVYLRARERDGIPTRIVLDLDGTDDPTHGHQEGSAYHGYYDQHQYLPLLIFDGDTDQLITAVLRRGDVHASHGVVAILTRVVRALRARWPEVKIALRADSGCAVPAIYAFCEREDLEYTIGLIPNPRLMALAAPLLAEAQAQAEAASAGTPVRQIGEATYRAGSWPKARRVIIKAEQLSKGPNTRFVVTNRTDAAAAVYAWYTDRGEPENWIKDLKRACFADRLSDHRFWANQFRLLMHGAAYWLLDTVRRWLTHLAVPRMQLDTLRLRLVKIGGWVRERTHEVRLHLASSHPGQPLWHLLATRPGRRE